MIRRMMLRGAARRVPDNLALRNSDNGKTLQITKRRKNTLKMARRVSHFG